MTVSNIITEDAVLVQALKSQRSIFCLILRCLGSSYTEEMKKDVTPQVSFAKDRSGILESKIQKMNVSLRENSV